MHERYPRIYELARPLLATRENELHTRVAFSFGMKLLAAERGNEAVVLPAIVLHDVGWKFVPEALQLKAFGPRVIDKEINRIHEIEGARHAKDILQRVEYDPDLIEEIVEIIRGHDSRKEPLSLNDAIVKDADKLWRFSEEALVVDPKRFAITPAVYVEWLRHEIPRCFYTETARRIATEEHRQRVLCLGVPET